MATIDRPKDEAPVHIESDAPGAAPPHPEPCADIAAEPQEFFFWGINELYVAP